jgi:hypothetical protein
VIADTPPTYGISTALVVVFARGGHATKPSALRAVNISVRPHVSVTAGSGFLVGNIPPKPKGCHATYSKITPAGKRLGVTRMITYWCKPVTR